MNPVRNKALLLDRDGVINLEKGYVHRRQDFHFREGIFDLCRAAQMLDYLPVVVTNQAGIARGYYTESEFWDLTEWMVQEFARHEVKIFRVYYCPYHPIHGVGKYKYDSPDRKPKPGMLLQAQTDLNLDLMSSILIGDKLSDIKAATAAGVGTKILLYSSQTELPIEESICHVADSLDDIRSRFFSVLPAKQGSTVGVSG
jgi:D-glycero-D-manno-heptose 1,7-bisphosphate phosphatase